MYDTFISSYSRHTTHRALRDALTSRVAWVVPGNAVAGYHLCTGRGEFNYELFWWVDGPQQYLCGVFGC